MNSDSPSLPLYELDTPATHAVNSTIVADILARNLDALRTTQSDLADRVASREVPTHWRIVESLDRTMTWRTEHAGEPPAWLGNTAIPQRRAAAQLERFATGQPNLALPALGTGAELTCLLQRLPLHESVFVFFEDEIELLAVLHVRDLEPAIQWQRCVFVPPGDELAYLTGYLVQNDGLLPPARIALPDLAAPLRTQQVQSLCEQVMQRRQAAWVERRTQLAALPTKPPATTPRLAVVSLHPRDALHRVSWRLADAAEAAGWSVLRRKMATPRDGDGAAHASALAEFAPSVTLCVNHTITALPLAPGGRHIAWAVDARLLPETLADDGTTWLAGSPHIERTLLGRAVRPDQVRAGYVTCTPDADASDVQTSDESAVVILGDLSTLDPKRYGITLESHRRLWDTLCELAATAWTETHWQGAHLVRQAEQKLGVRIGDDASRRQIEGFAADVIVPTVAREQIARALSAAGLKLRLLGRGWERLWDGREFGPRELIADDPLDLPDAWGARRPRACVVAAAPDPLTPALVQAVAWGWPVLLNIPTAPESGAPLAPVLLPERHYARFNDTRELLEALQSIENEAGPSRKRTERAQQHVCTHHSHGARVRELGAWLGMARE